MFISRIQNHEPSKQLRKPEKKSGKKKVFSIDENKLFQERKKERRRREFLFGPLTPFFNPSIHTIPSPLTLTHSLHSQPLHSPWHQSLYRSLANPPNRDFFSF
jgi:hypothetical protein